MSQFGEAHTYIYDLVDAQNGFIYPTIIQTHFAVIMIKAEGNCLFESIQKTLQQYADFGLEQFDNHETIRKLLCDYYKQDSTGQINFNPKDHNNNDINIYDHNSIKYKILNQYKTGDNDDYKILDPNTNIQTKIPHIDRICDNYAYANEMDVYALCDILKVNICIFLYFEEDNCYLLQEYINNPGLPVLCIKYANNHYEPMLQKSLHIDPDNVLNHSSPEATIDGAFVAHPTENEKFGTVKQDNDRYNIHWDGDTTTTYYTTNEIIQIVENTKTLFGNGRRKTTKKKKKISKKKKTNKKLKKKTNKKLKKKNKRTRKYKH